MKIKVLIVLTLVSIRCLSQTIGNFKIDNIVLSNPIKVQFCVYQQDSVSINIYNRWGQPIVELLPKDLYKNGTYKLEYTEADSLKSDSYIYQLKSSNKSIQGTVVFIDFEGSTKSSDFLKITYVDSIKVYDTIKIAVFDTTKVLIIDTLDCIKTNTTLNTYETSPKTKSLVFHDNLMINFSDVDNLRIYDLSGKLVRIQDIDDNLIPLGDLKFGMYIGLFYQKGSIVKTIKLIKE